MKIRLPTLLIAAGLILASSVFFAWGPRFTRPEAVHVALTSPVATMDVSPGTGDGKSVIPNTALGSSLLAPDTGKAGTASAEPQSAKPEAALWAAVKAARHAILPLTSQEAALPRNAGVRFFAANPGQDLTARFLDGVVRVESGGAGAWSGELSRGTLGEIPRPELRNGRIEYQHADGVVEWYENRPEGLEHGFTLAERPPVAHSDEVRIDVGLDGLVARTARGGGDPALEFVDPATGTAVLRYEKLKVWDATGRELPARMTGRGGSVTLAYHDAGATYPVTVDPLIVSLESVLGPGFDGDGESDDGFGESVALSGDTAVIGTALDDTPAGTNAGSAYVFERNGAVWSLQGKLMAADGATDDEFGRSVALSGDEAIAVIGAGLDDTAAGADAGSAYVFTRDGGPWVEEARLSAPDGAAGDRFGAAVSVSGDTILVGAPDDDTPAGIDAGSARVFVRDGQTWQEQAMPLPVAGAAGLRFGHAVSLSGQTAVVGSPEGAGSAHVFVRNGASWGEQATLSPPAGVLGAFGWSVAIDGNSALIGAPKDDSPWWVDAGSAHLYIRSGTQWSHQAMLVADVEGSRDEFGRSVALAGDSALVGARLDDTAAGADSGSAHAFRRNGSVWLHEGLLTSFGTAAGGRFGTSVALSGATALVGASMEGTDAGPGAGAAYTFERGTEWTEGAVLSAGMSGGDNFSTSVALDGDLAVVGARYDDTPLHRNAGSAYVFQREGTVWSRQAKLTDGEGREEDKFGESVAVHGDTVLIGSPRADLPAKEDAGVAFVFARSGSGWTQEAKLVHPQAAANDDFGGAVAVFGTTAVIGASGDETVSGPLNGGSVQVFVRNLPNWTHQAQLTASDAASNDSFGRAVALFGDTVFVGAPSDDTTAGTNAGSVYVYTRSGTTWSQRQRMTQPGAAASMFFGSSISISGDYALVGAPFFGGTGAAYAFQYNVDNWQTVQTLLPPDGASGDRFGASVALWGDFAVVGAPGHDPGAVNGAGSAYLFERIGSTWQPPVKLVAGTPGIDDDYGSAVAISGNTVVVGAPYDESVFAPTGDVRRRHGSLHVYRLALPAVETAPATLVTDAGAVLGGTVTDDGGRTVTRKGVVVATLPDPSLENGATIVADSAGMGAFVLNGAQFAPGTTYHVRAFATNAIGTGYGPEIVFTTGANATFNNGVANFSRSLLPGGRQVFNFTLTSPRIVSLSTLGNGALRAELYDSEGNLITSFTGDTNFDLEQLLLAGGYALHVFREEDGGSIQTFDLTIDTSIIAASRPDVAVGTSPGALTGRSVYSPASQIVNLTSRRLRAVTGHATVANRGKLPDVLAVSGGPGTAFFKVVWSGPTGNITAGLNTGTYRTTAIADGTAPVSLTAKITPNKKKLTGTNKKTKRKTILKKTFRLILRASSTLDPAISDAATIQLRTK